VGKGNPLNPPDLPDQRSIGFICPNSVSIISPISSVRFLSNLRPSGAPRSVVWEAGENPAHLIVRSNVSEEDGSSRKARVKALLSGK